jgi:dCMP deaminase
MVWKGELKNRFDWDVTFVTEAFLTSQRSIDPRTNHGACLVSQDNRILSKGYNGPISQTNDGYNDEIMKSVDKYHIVIHAEENCLLNYYGGHSDLVGATMYVTGEPCHRCLRMILQKGVRRIVHGHVRSNCVDENDNYAKKLLFESLSYEVDIVDFKNMEKVKLLLQKTLDYIDYKEKDNG